MQRSDWCSQFRYRQVNCGTGQLTFCNLALAVKSTAALRLDVSGNWRLSGRARRTPTQEPASHFSRTNKMSKARTATQLVRNIGIIAHIDAGKTTTTERILYFTGASHKMGDVDDGNTTTDFDPEEAQRGITIYAACVTCRWKEALINIIDTPGHVDFTAEVERSLRVLDGAVVVFSAVEGVEAQSETVWRQADKYGVPRICFINKLDRIGADWKRTLEEIRTRLCHNPSAGTEKLPLPVNLPGVAFGKVGDFDINRTVIDLINQKVLVFAEESEDWKVSVHEVPEDIKDDVATFRLELVEAAAATDDAALEEYFTNNDLSPERLTQVVRAATLSNRVVPMFFGTSLKCVGVHPLLDGVASFLPSPLDRPAIKGILPATKKEPEKPGDRPTDPKAPFAGLIFKIIADKHNDLYFMRVYSGIVKAGTRMLNPRTGKKEFVTQLWHIQADSREKVEQDEAIAGDIVGVVGLKEVVTGDTLCDPGEPILLEPISFPETVISMAVEPESSADKDKLDLTLRRLALQDPTFTWRTDPDSGQTIVSGMGELHLEIIKNRMERDFNLKIKVHRPRVTYKETISQETLVEGTFDRETANGKSYAYVKLRLVSQPAIAGVKVINTLSSQQAPAVFREALIHAVTDESQTGLSGFPMTQLEVHIEDFKHQDKNTNEAAIYAAVSEAFRSVVNRVQTVVLEPVMKLEVNCPDESVGNVQSDLNARRAAILATERRGPFYVIEARVPLAKMFGYSSVVRSMSQGRASYTMEPDHYAPAQELPDYM